MHFKLAHQTVLMAVAGVANQICAKLVSGFYFQLLTRIHSVMLLYVQYIHTETGQNFWFPVHDFNCETDRLFFPTKIKKWGDSFVKKVILLCFFLHFREK